MKEPKLFVDERGNKLWKLYGEYHRLDGPAVEYSDGYKQWRVVGKLHRLDGPAIERADGTKDWFIDGKHYKTQQEHALAVFLLMNEYERT
jgi:hypothetical protein